MARGEVFRAASVLLSLFLGVEPEGEEAGHARHHDVGHERDHHHREDQRAEHHGEPTEQGIEQHEHHGGQRKYRQPGDHHHFVARRGRIALFGGECEPGLQSGEYPYPGLLVDQVTRLLVPAAALFGALPALQVAGVVELEDDLVLVVVGTARPEDVRACLLYTSPSPRD